MTLVRSLSTIIGLLALLALPVGELLPRLVGAQDAPLPLSAYPRPPQDNGLGIHWSTNVYGQSPEVVDYFVAEMEAMGIKWVKFLNDGTDGRHNEYLIQQLVAHGMMPIMRIYQKCNKPLDLGSLRRLVRHYRPMGVFYYELYNEPELSGIAGGWCDDERPDPDRMVDMWIPAARVVQEEGGFPSLPSMFPPSTKDPDWQESFFIRFLRRIKDTGNTNVLYRSWGAVHNYFLNHPLRYPYDEVNLKSVPLTAAEISRYGLSPAEVQAINEARKIARRPRSEGGYYVGSTVDEDNSCFLQFLAYRDRFYEIFGFEIPLISTEGGATVGSSEDPRYPRVTPALQAEMTIQAFEYMLDEAPPYYFAFTSWLIAERAMDNFNPTWESWAWYKNREGDHLPVVDALKSHPRRGQARRNQPGGMSVTQPLPTATKAPTATPTVSRVQPAVPTAPTLPRPQAAPVGASALPLSAYPRPANDNGWGIHWTPTLFSQPPDVVDRLMEEVSALGLRWVKLMQPDEPKLQHTYLIGQLIQRGIMPVLRVYRPHNEPYQNLGVIVRAGLAQGIFYYELYNEPNVMGEAGGWRPGEEISVARIVDLWIPAAREIAALGGYPGLPALAPGGSYDDMRFLAEFLELLQQQNALDTLNRAWLPLHNYFLNHPLDYPEDPVNLWSTPLLPAEINERGLSVAEVEAINHARRISRLPRDQGGYYVGDTIDQDSNGFRKFEAYRNIVYLRLGRELPIISTEGGAIVGSQEDPRYPRVTEADVARQTRAAFLYMLDQAPAYYFAFMPWLLTNMEGGSSDPAWERAAWYQVGGRPRPVVAAIKEIAAQGRTRRNVPVDQGSMTVAPTLPPTPLPTVLPTSAPPTPPSPARPTVPSLPAAAPTVRPLLQAAPPTVSETYLLIPTYPYDQALVPTSPDDPIYPYPRLDFDRLGLPTPRTYRAVILENTFTRLVLLPELGGRIYQWVDKVSGRALLYQNPVIKPTRWGHRGWWIGAGGFEWAFPVDEHGFNEYVPWDYRINSDPQWASVTMARTDERTGLRAEVTVSLDATHPYFTVAPRLTNPTAGMQRYQLWLNAMLSPGGNRVSPTTRWVWPSDSLTVHSSADETAFPAGREMAWPLAGGRDLRSYSNWPAYLGFFGVPQRGFMGVYDAEIGVGIVRVFPADEARGTKLFAAPGLDPRLWTDDDSTYLELWGGATSDFNTYAELAPGQSVGWTERWYATGPIGPVTWASDDLALGLEVGAEEVTLGVAAMIGVQGQLLLRRDGVLVNRWTVRLAPGQSAATQWRVATPATSRWQVQLVNGQGVVIASAEATGVSATPASPPTPTPASGPSSPLSPTALALSWDSRLDELGVRLVRASPITGQLVWRLTEARWEDPQESRGLHHAFIRVLDEQGRPVTGQRVKLIWRDGSAEAVTNEEGANFPLYGPLGEYSVEVDGLSDRVVGLGLPRKEHVNYRLTFQRMIVGG